MDCRSQQERKTMNRGLNLKWEVVEKRGPDGDWQVEAIDHESEGEVYIVRFYGHGAEERAREYAKQQSGNVSSEEALAARDLLDEMGIGALSWMSPPSSEELRTRRTRYKRARSAAIGAPK